MIFVKANSKVICFFLFTIFYFLFLVSFAQTTIKGEAKSYKTKEISAVVYEDYITNTEKILNTSTVNDSGYFQLQFNLDKITNVVLKSENAKADLFVEPGKTYDVILFPKDTIRYINNSIEQQVELGILKTDSNDINTLIADFNRTFDVFWENNYQFFVANKYTYDKVDSFKIAVKKNYVGITNSTFLNYVKYKIASLEETASRSRKGLFEDYINGKSILYDNSEYMSFFNKFFTPDISSLMPKDDYINKINQAVPFKEFIKVFKSDKFLVNDTLLELVAIKALYHSYNYPLYKNDNILYLLKTASKEGMTADNRKIAENMVRKISRLNIGSPAPYFELADKNDKSISLKNFKGKYVYLDFWATWCGPCQAEMKIIPELKKEYGSKIEFVSISIDDDAEVMKQFLKKNPQYNWIFLYTGSKSKTKEDYMVYSVPTYYLIDPYGNLLQSPADRPSGNIEKVFDGIMKKTKK